MVFDADDVEVLGQDEIGVRATHGDCEAETRVPAECSNIPAN